MSRDISWDLMFGDKPVTHLPPQRVSMYEMDVDRLARALHDWKKTQTLAGCGWRFGSVVDGEVLCPCRVHAGEILGRVV